MINKDKLKSLWPYSGLPVVIAVLLLFQVGTFDAFYILQSGLLLVFGYIIAVLDFQTKKIPNKLVLAMLGAWIIIVVPQLFFNIDATIYLLIDSLIGFVIAGGMFLLVYLISRRGLGGGDVKFMAVAGLYLGMSGVLPAMLVGSVLAGLTGFVLILIKKIGRKDAIPLAPFLYVGILATIFFV
ncbi:MAG: A24 family peptidase [Oscillospiraceae bacterium]|nr:A24 family peptidase [Oscillospiraceae bacterium]